MIQARFEQKNALFALKQGLAHGVQTASVTQAG
jgi:hypothetical protein